MKNEGLKLFPLGGLGEIGMNCMVLEWKDTMVLIDCGIQFPDASYAGVELLTPDFQYVLKHKKKLKGIVVTHGHDDHVGAIPLLLKEMPLEVYCSPFPEGLLRQKLIEHQGIKSIHYHPVVPDKPFKIGPFRFHPIRVAHSIIEAMGFAIETPVGTIIHTGDFKHDPNEKADGKEITFSSFEKWGKKGVELLLSDSTNAERLGHTLSEKDIQGSFEKIISKQKGRLFIALFASNIKRVERLIKIAAKQKKKVALSGRSMHSYTRIAHGINSFDIPADTLVLIEDHAKYPDDSMIFLLTGSQAEPQAALVRIAQGTHRDVQLKNGDTVILSSRFIPGNERAITQMIDQLYRMGADVMYESIHQIHVSGHGFQDELKMMLQAVKPRHFIPIHGEYRHLAKHARLARECGVPSVHIIENGQVVYLDEEEHLELGEQVTLNKGCIVGGLHMQGSAELFNQRIQISKTGVVNVVVVRDRRSKRLVIDPIVQATGLLFQRDIDPEDAMSDAVQFAADVADDYYDKHDLPEILRVEMRRYFKQRVSYKPLVHTVVADV